MASTILRYSSLAVATAGATYGLIIYRRMAPADSAVITTTRTIPESFRTSYTIRKFVNPRDHISMCDTRFMTVDIPPNKRDVSDEVLLAQFVKGFFGGWVFFPESVALKLGGMELTKPSALEQVPVSRRIWKASELSPWHLPPLQSLLFGCFLAADIRLAVGDKPSAADKQSYVDFVFGSDTSQFAGSHRFSLRRTNSPEGTLRVHVEMNGLTCNPLVDKPITPAALFTFHEIYANLLFREAVSEMKRWLDSKT